MHSALVIVEVPKPLAPHEQSQWVNLLRELEAIAERESSVEPLGEGVMTVKLAGGTRGLVAVLHAAQHYRHRVLFFDEAPEWVRTVPKEG